MSEQYLRFFDKYGIKLIIVPKEAHYRMGAVERLRAVRRLQLYKMQQGEPNLELADAVRMACNQRNRLRNVHGSSPAQMVFGYNPASGGLIDEPAPTRPDVHEAIQQDHAVRHLASKAFYEANHDALLKRSILSRSRPELAPLQLGDYAFYWRSPETKLDAHRWRGPGLVCAIEPRATEDGILRPHVYWLAHGSSLVRCAPEHVRAEVPAERLARLESMPDTALRQPVCDRVRNSLIPVQGPVRFLDLAPGPTFSNAKAPLLSATSPPPLANEPLEPKEDDSMTGRMGETTEQDQQAAAAQTAAAADTEPHTHTRHGSCRHTNSRRCRNTNHSNSRRKKRKQGKIEESHTQR